MGELYPQWMIIFYAHRKYSWTLKSKVRNPRGNLNT